MKPSRAPSLPPSPGEQSSAWIVQSDPHPPRSLSNITPNKTVEFRSMLVSIRPPISSAANSAASFNPPHATGLANESGGGQVPASAVTPRALKQLIVAVLIRCNLPDTLVCMNLLQLIPSPLKRKNGQYYAYSEEPPRRSTAWRPHDAAKNPACSRNSPLTSSECKKDEARFPSRAPVTRKPFRFRNE